MSGIMNSTGAVSGILGTTVGTPANTPAFEATITTEQNPSSGVDTKINFDSEIFDTAGAYDTSNKRFTVPSGQAGKYFIYCNACCGSSSNETLRQVQLFLYLGGSVTRRALSTIAVTSSYSRYHSITVNSTLELAVGNYIEMFTNVTISSGTVEIRTAESFFGAYKIIE